MASPVGPICPRLEATESPRQPAALTDDLLEQIFLRASSPADLARVSAASVSFRGLVADPKFLRRYRSIHPPLFLGFLGNDRFYPTGAPDPNAPAARAVARAADFTFDYLPRGRGRWVTCDVRDGRVLLEFYPDKEEDDAIAIIPDLAVCDPLSRQYVLLPAIPDDLVASVQVQAQNVESFLVPTGDQEDTSFTVVARAENKEKFVAFVFSSGSGGWNVGVPTSSDALSLPLLPTIGNVLLHPHHYVYGCFYWKLLWNNKLIRLNMKNMEFSSLYLPLDHARRRIVIVEAGEGMLGMFSRNYEDDDLFLYYTMNQNGGERSNEWKMEKKIPMPMGYTCYIVGAFEGYILLLGGTKGTEVYEMCFSLDVKSMKIEMVGRMVDVDDRHYPYFGFPPSISPRRI